MNGLLELLTTKHYMVSPDFVHGIRATLEHNLNGHVMLAEEEKTMGLPLRVSEDFDQKKAAQRAYDDDETASDVKEPFVNLMVINGPITRNGGACSYGSVQHRDMMMEAADNKNCIGHVFLINTPGGSAWAKNDYQQAIDYAHSKNQPVIAFVDGLCASAGMYLAALCDERYYMHPKDEIGCIGVMAAFYTEKDGSKCEYTNETYHELYDPESFDKNKEIRDIANDGNDELLIADLARLGVEFRADVLKACPNAKDEHLHGKVFAAEEVDGILMDGQKNLGEVFSRLIDLSASKGSKAGKSAKAIYQQMHGTDGSVRMTAAQAKENLLNPLNNNVNMKEKFPQVFALLGVEEMECSEEGTFLNASLLETLNGKIEAMQQETAQAKELAESLTKQVDELKAAHEQAISDLNAEHTAAIEEKDKAISDMEAAHKEAIEAKDAEIATLTENAGKADEALKAKDEEIAGQKAQAEQLQADLDGARASLTTATETIAERDQQIQDLNAQVEELTRGAGQEPQAGAAPHNNGGGAEVPVIAATTPVAKKGQSYDEMRQTWKGEK